MSLPRIEFKPGVYLKYVDYRFLWIAKVIWEVFQEFGIKAAPVVTSACDGKHGPGSLHPEGLAWDWRVWIIPEDIRQRVVDRVKEMAHTMSPLYDIIYGDAQHLDHIHVEWDDRKENRKEAKKDGMEKVQ